MVRIPRRPAVQIGAAFLAAIGPFAASALRAQQPAAAPVSFSQTDRDHMFEDLDVLAARLLAAVA